jgi:hypothetical protein
MRTAHVIGLGSGALLLLGVGIATISVAQQPGDSPAPAHHDRQASPQDLGALEAEVELLQIEHDAARDEMQIFLKKCERLELLRETDMVSPIGMAFLFEREFCGREAKDEERKAIGRALLEAGEEKAKEIESAAVDDQKRISDGIRAARDRRRKDFLRKTKELNDKKRSLSEARRPSLREAR